MQTKNIYTVWENAYIYNYNYRISSSTLPLPSNPIGSMYGIFTYIWLIFMVNVGKYTIHGSYGNTRFLLFLRLKPAQLSQRLRLKPAQLSQRLRLKPAQLSQCLRLKPAQLSQRWLTHRRVLRSSLGRWQRVCLKESLGMRSFTRMGGMEPEKIPILRRGFGFLGIYIYTPIYSN